MPDGGVKFAERKHIQDVLAYLSVLHNPLDAADWNHIILLEEGVGKITAGAIVTDIHENDCDLESIKTNTDIFNIKQTAISYIQSAVSLRHHKIEHTISVSNRIYI